MACLGFRCGRGIAAQESISGRAYRFVPSVHLSNRVAPPKRPPTPAAMMATVSCRPLRENQLKTVDGGRSRGGAHTGGSGGPEKLDRWMKESVVDIVQNLRGAPLFVHVYGGGCETRVRTERAVAEDWALLKSKWANGEEPTPEGIILVEELEEDGEGILEEEEEQDGESTKAWGVLIQGKGDDGGLACYLLKTSKAGGGNLGLFCTHYCLVRVKSFRETARSQLTNCWLV